jgi:hypothetical protein
MRRKMTMDKFIVMCEWGDAISPLTLEEKGELFESMFNYQKGIEPTFSTISLKLVWGFLKPNIDRINDKYQKNIENGKKGGPPKNNKNASKTTEDNPKQPNLTEDNPKQPNLTEDNPKQPNLSNEMLLKTTENNPKTTYKEKEKEKEKEKDTNISTNRTSREIFEKVEEQELFKSFLNDGFSVEESIQLTKDAIYILN